jgi:hypothetical protein
MIVVLPNNVYLHKGHGNLLMSEVYVMSCYDLVAANLIKAAFASVYYSTHSSAFESP